MASHITLSKKQSVALSKYLQATLGDSVDELVEKIGQEDAFTLLTLNQRLQDREAKEG